MTTRETEGQICLWCGGRLPDRQRRHGSARKFCNDHCRHQHRSALCQLGQETADQRFAAPGALRSRSSKARSLHEGVESDEKVSTPVEAAPARPERAYGFCQHGHLWYATDPIGRKVGSPVKTPEQAKRLARQYTAKWAPEPSRLTRVSFFQAPEP